MVGFSWLAWAIRLGVVVGGAWGEGFPVQPGVGFVPSEYLTQVDHFDCSAGFLFKANHAAPVLQDEVARAGDVVGVSIGPFDPERPGV